MQWHVCLQHLLRWMWSDLQAGQRHFKEVDHNLLESADSNEDFDIVIHHDSSDSDVSSVTPFTQNQHSLTECVKLPMYDGYKRRKLAMDSSLLHEFRSLSHSKEYFSRESQLKGRA